MHYTPAKRYNSTMKTFTEKVYEIAAQIPKGNVSTYKQLAKLAGSPKAVRAVGAAMRNNPETTVVPCHRVLASDGSMHGYSARDGIQTKIKKLQEEGVRVIDGKVDLNVFLWHQSPEE